jgi:Tol biopolymer transport system component
MTMTLRQVGASLVLMVALVSAGAAQRGVDGDKQFQAALHKEMVDGDLKAAIEEYRKVSTRPGVGREIEATALVRMAACYEKLGDAQARAIYERIARDYSDQKEAVVLARARLGGAATSEQKGLALRKVWSDDTPPIAGARGDTEYAISADGRFMTYVGNFNLTLFLRDLTTGRDRALTGDPCCGIYVSTFSRDGSSVAFNACTADQTTCEIRIVSLSGTGVPAFRRVFGSEELNYIAPKDWSPDGKLIAVSVRRKDRTAQVGVIDIADGRLKTLKSVDWRGPTEMFFSPDGRTIAYDQPVSENLFERDVFMIAVDGSRELPAVTHPSNDAVMGWSPDGTRLLFASDRSGAVDLWAQPIVDGRAQGSPSLLKPDIGPTSAMGMTRTGALYLRTRTNDSDIEVATVDLPGTGRETSAASRPIQRFTGSNMDPAWSPDGTALAYRSVRGEEVVLAIRSMETGDTKELHLQPRLGYFLGLSWAPDGASFAVYGTDIKGRSGVFRIDARTGAVVPIVYQSHAENISYEGVSWSRDGRRLWYHGQRGSIYEVDVASGTERVLISAPPVVDPSVPPDGKLGPISVSPDGQWIATARRDAPAKSTVVTLVPIDGGAPRDLLRVDDPDWVNNTSIPWLPDGRAIFVRRMKDADGRTSELWRVPVDGTAPHKLEFNVSRVAPYAQGRISVNPTGDRLAFVVSENKPRTEVWALENFLPPLAANK